MKEIQHINAISLYVNDIQQSRAFYEKTFGLLAKQVSPDNIVINLGGIYLNLLHMSLAYEKTTSERGALPLEINIWVENVDEVYQTLKERGIAFLAPPSNQPWGMRNITFFDPDGHRFEIAQAIKAKE